MKDYSDCEVVLAPKSAFPEGIYLRERMFSLCGSLVRTFRRYLPQISIMLILLLGAVCFTYYYYVTT